jgi:hypothetical protein
MKPMDYATAAAVARKSAPCLKMQWGRTESGLICTWIKTERDERR